MQRVEIRPIDLAKDAKSFIRFPFKVYKGDDHWVPPLLFERKTFFDPAKNPYFSAADVQCFGAYRDGELVGTISAQIDKLHQNVEPGVGFFGFFEFVEDASIARCLLRSAGEWLRERGMTRVIGPFNFSFNHEFGLLIDGFDLDPVVLTTYNRPYYPRVYEEAGLTPAKDFYAYWMDQGPVPDRIAKIAARFLERHPQVRIRSVNLKDFDKELDRVKVIYNDAWEDNWGFQKPTDDEFAKIAKDLRPMVDERLTFIAEVDGEPAAFSLTLPDFNQVIKPMNGTLFPTGWWHFLTGKKRGEQQIRIFLLGVRKQFQHLALGAPLYVKTWEAGIAMKVRGAEASLILDDNVKMRGALEKLGARIYKTYRIYGMDL